MFHLLLIDDSPDDRLLVIHELKREFSALKIEEIIEEEGFNRALKTGNFNLVITDYQLRWNDGLTVLREIKSRYPNCPVIMFTDSGSQEIAVEAMKSGLDDYIIKSPRHYVRLPAAVRSALEQSKAKEVLQAETIERQKVEKQLRDSLREKEVLLKEIHHRVKNNLQIISSLLNLQADYLKDEQAIEIFRVSQNRIDSMSLIHEKLYKSRDLARINLAEYIQDLVASLFNAYEVNPEAITLKISVDNVLLSIDVAVPCGLMLNELILNSIKHAFPDGRSGEICILGIHSNNDNEFLLIVRDNGIGLPKKFDFKNTKTLGLQLVNILTDQLKGTIEINTDRGVEFKIAFHT